jgi:hypothetical protein
MTLARKPKPTIAQRKTALGIGQCMYWLNTASPTIAASPAIVTPLLTGGVYR